MAYSGNKTNTQNVVTLDGDQTIAGAKTFSDNIVAEGFYDSKMGSRILPPAIISIENDGENRIIISKGNGSAVATPGLTFESGCLSSESFAGSGENLTNLNAENITGKIPLKNVNLGNVFSCENNTLNLNTNNTITAENERLEVNLSMNGGLSCNADSGICIDLMNTDKKKSVSNSDKFVITDSNDSYVTKSITATDLKNYLQNVLTFTRPAGNSNQIQVNNRGKFHSSANLLFENNTLVTTNARLAGKLNIGKNSIDNNNVVLAISNNAANNILKNNTFTFNLDEQGSKLEIKVKLSDGNIKTGSIDLS